MDKSPAPTPALTTEFSPQSRIAQVQEPRSNLLVRSPFCEHNRGIPISIALCWASPPWAFLCRFMTRLPVASIEELCSVLPEIVSVDAVVCIVILWPWASFDLKRNQQSLDFVVCCWSRHQLLDLSINSPVMMLARPWTVQTGVEYPSSPGSSYLTSSPNCSQSSFVLSC